MIIKYEGTGRNGRTFKEIMSELFYIGRYEWDDADYGFSIILFGREWNWIIYKDKESFFEYQQMKHDYDARCLRYEYENGA
jgi:hypothetical protein